MKYAIRLEDGTLLACPEIPRGLPREIRVKAYEYVLRRQPALAFLTVEGAVEDTTESRAARLGVLMAETPHRNRRWAA